MVAGLEKLGSSAGGVFVIGSGVDIAPLKPHLEAATSLAVSVAEEPGTALARGAALASANAPLFVSSTAALAYSLDPGTGAVEPSSLPEYLRFPMLPQTPRSVATNSPTVRCRTTTPIPRQSSSSTFASPDAEAVAPQAGPAAR